jgi:hypothetical protein
MKVGFVPTWCISGFVCLAAVADARCIRKLVSLSAFLSYLFFSFFFFFFTVAHWRYSLLAFYATFHGTDGSLHCDAFSSSRYLPSTYG